MLNLLQDFMARTRMEFSVTSPTKEQLSLLGEELRSISKTTDLSQYPAAQPNEELMHEISVATDGGPSLYLVSDGIGVDTPPHTHQTWAVIVGIQGEEFNILYQPPHLQGEAPTQTSQCSVGKGDLLIMETDEIHAIDSARGIHPTFHIHLYGRSLISLPSFKTRCF